MAHVLLVEPDTVLASTYQKALRQHGFTVAVAGSAQAAIHAAEDKTPALVILELQLSGHGGIEFLYEFRSYTEWQAIPVLLHTLVPSQTLRPYEQAFEILHITGAAYKPATTLRRLIELAKNNCPVTV